jgi:hypothetical protein
MSAGNRFRPAGIIAGFLFMILACAGISTAQITITASDVANVFVPGKTVTSHIDTATRSIDIGAIGSTAWDFSGLNLSYSASSVTVKPDTTPYFSYYPGSTHCERIGSGSSAIYSYFTLGTDLLVNGTASDLFYESRTIFSPPEVSYKLPMTYGTNWTSTHVDSTYTILPSPLPISITVSNVTLVNTVDAYGNMTLPGGATYPAVRLKSVRTSATIHSTTKSISYTIVAANGAQVVIVPSDTLQPDHGTINVADVSWTNPLTTGVRETTSIPASFELKQNYPNPFNPTTEVSFVIGHSALVTLQVYDVLGRLVTTLVNEARAPGAYDVKWDATNQPSGVYYYRLKAGEFTDVKKMLLVK